MEVKSIAGNKSYRFALKIDHVYRALTKEKKEFISSKQLLRSGTSIGANVNEGLAAESKKDFTHKFHIAMKETRESIYWLHLLKDIEYLEESVFVSLSSDCKEISKMLSSIIITTKKKYLSKMESNVFTSE